MQILVADKQPRVRFGLRVLLSRQPGLKVVGEAAHAEDLLTQIEAHHPDLVLLGWGLAAQAAVNPSACHRGEPIVCTKAPSERDEGPSRSEPSGQGLLSALRRVHPDLSVIALSGRPEERQVALAAGADAFVSKCDPPERLLAAIGNCWCERGQSVHSNGESDIGHPSNIKLPQMPVASGGFLMYDECIELVNSSQASSAKTERRER